MRALASPLGPACRCRGSPCRDRIIGDSLSGVVMADGFTDPGRADVTLAGLIVRQGSRRVPGPVEGGPGLVTRGSRTGHRRVPDPCRRGRWRMRDERVRKLLREPYGRIGIATRIGASPASSVGPQRGRRQDCPHVAAPSRRIWRNSGPKNKPIPPDASRQNMTRHSSNTSSGQGGSTPSNASGGPRS